MAIEGKFVTLDARLYDYVVAHGHNADPVLAALADETAAKLGRVAGMQIAPEQGTLITGYSAICVARALPADGNLLCCDVSEEWTAIARRYWRTAGVDDRITLKIAPALATLRALPLEPCFDFAFIDADKSNYRNYFEEIFSRTRPGGLILIDNVLWSGEVLNPANQTGDTRAIRDLNDFLAHDDRVEVVMIAVSDGLTICRKKPRSSRPLQK